MIKSITRVISVLLTFSLLFSLTACGGSSEETNTVETTLDAPTAVVTETPQDETMGETTVQVIEDFNGTTFSTDMDIQTVLSRHPIPTMLTLRLAPEKLVSVDTVFTMQYLGDADKSPLLQAFDPDAVAKMPVTNVFFNGIDSEAILNLNPEYIITMSKDPYLSEYTVQLGIPVISVSKDTLADYAETMRILGVVLNNTQDANEMADYWTNAVEEVSARTSSAAQEDRPTVYYCGSGDIYATPGTDTIMSSIIDLAGGYSLGNEVSTSDNSTSESIEVSMEQILTWDPEIVIAYTSEQYEEVMSSPEWAEISAVKNGRVYAQLVYSLMDGLCAVPALYWLEQMINDPGDGTLSEEVLAKQKEYYELFFLCELTDAQLNEVS